jgi:hypothetical protein
MSTLASLMSVYSCVHMQPLENSHTDFREFRYWEMLLKSAVKPKFCLKSDNNKWNFT